MYTEHSPLLGPLRAGPAQASAYIIARPHSGYSDQDIAAAIVPAYFSVCLSVGVDPLLALAQMIHETGNLTSFWSQRPQRNPAGIGVTGQRQGVQPTMLVGWSFNNQRSQWETGVSFNSWQNDAIPAHVGRLLCYALPLGAGTPVQQALIARAVGYRAFPNLFRGSAPTLRQLGKVHNPKGAQGAGWASPGTDYGRRIAETANRIVGL